MKKLIFLTAGILVLYSLSNLALAASEKDIIPLEQTINIQCSPDLYAIVHQWSDEYNHSIANNGMKLNLTQTNNFNELSSASDGLTFLSKSYFESLKNDNLWKIVIGRDVVVPIINTNNPKIDQILQKGITTSALTEMIKSQDLSLILKDDEKVQLNYYLNTDQSINSFLSNLSGYDKNMSNKISKRLVNDSKELISAVQQDIYGIGFCRLNDVVNPADQSWLENITVLPIDKNNNGKLDYFEKIYTNPVELTRGVWIGKYPKLLINNFYIISKNVPENETEVSFLKWIMYDGQQMLVSNGYSELVNSEKQANIEKLTNFKFYPETTKANSYIVLKIILFIMILAALVIRIFSRTGKPDRQEVNSYKNKAYMPGIITDNSISLPDGLYFDKTHTWIFMEKNGEIKVGIDDFLQHITGKLTRVKMKSPGESLKKNDPLLSLVQDGKQLNVYAPISGEIVAINEKLVNEPETINNSPYSEGWVYTIKPTNYLREIQFLRMAGKYREWLKNEIARLKDFLASTANIDSLKISQVSYQEGGEIIDQVLHEFGPEVWEEFQKKFIDSSALH